jgi:hypothetical protein
MAIPRHTPYNSRAFTPLKALLPTSWAAAGLLALVGCGSPPPPQPPAGAKTPEAPPEVQLGDPASDAGDSGTNQAGETQ